MATPEQQTQSMLMNIHPKTGRTLPEWFDLLSQAGHSKHGQMVHFLKVEHGVSHGYASLIAHKALGRKLVTSRSEDELLEAQYAGEKARLRPIYENIITAACLFGDDVTVSPKKTYVSLRRRLQFAMIKPSNKSRVDVGLKLPGREAHGRLEESGSFSSMVTHRVRIESPEEVDQELIGWLRRAYQQA